MNEIKLVKKNYEELQNMVIQLNTDKFILQSKIDKANELLDGLLKDAYYNGEYIQYDYSTNDLLELKDILKEDK